MSDQLFAETTYIIHNKHMERTSVPSAGFELAILAAGLRVRQHGYRDRHSRLIVAVNGV